MLGRAAIATCSTQLLETYYQAGEAYQAAQRWEEAVTAFAQAGNFRDAPTLRQEAAAKAGWLGEQVLVLAGAFLMGSAEGDSEAGSDEKPQHTVTLDAYWIDRTEVTQVQYQRCVDGGKVRGAVMQRRGPGDHPVVCVTWQDAANYCAWAGRRLPRRRSGRRRRGGRQISGRKYPWGDDAPSVQRLNYINNVGYHAGRQLPGRCQSLRCIGHGGERVGVGGGLVR